MCAGPARYYSCSSMPPLLRGRTDRTCDAEATDKHVSVVYQHNTSCPSVHYQSFGEMHTYILPSVKPERVVFGVFLHACTHCYTPRCRGGDMLMLPAASSTNGTVHPRASGDAMATYATLPAAMRAHRLRLYASAARVFASSRLLHDDVVLRTVLLCSVRAFLW